MKPREAYFGIGAPRAIPATLAGFRSEIERADPNNEILSSQTRRRAAAVHMFRYNDINANSIAVISSLVTWQGSIHKAEMDKLRAEFQNKIMGNYDGGVKNWLYRWVEGQVDEYNWEMHMKNLRLRRAILLVPSQRDTDDEKRQKKEEAAMLEAAYLWHKDRLEKTFRAAMAQAKALQENGIIPPNGELWNLDELRTRWQYFASFDPYKPAEDEQRTEKPNHGPSAFYHQLTPANKSSFWAQRWSKNVAASLYEPFSVYVDLEANYDGQMGAQMRYTFLTICDATVDRVVAFRREQGQIKAAGFEIDSPSIRAIGSSALSRSRHFATQSIQKSMAKALRLFLLFLGPLSASKSLLKSARRFRTSTCLLCRSWSGARRIADGAVGVREGEWPQLRGQRKFMQHYGTRLGRRLQLWQCSRPLNFSQRGALGRRAAFR